MKINKSNNECEFENLEIGSIFSIGGSYFIKCKDLFEISGQSYNCINVETGLIDFIKPTNIVLDYPDASVNLETD